MQNIPQDATEEDASDRLFFYKDGSPVKEAAVIIIKEKAGKFQPIRVRVLNILRIISL